MVVCECFSIIVIYNITLTLSCMHHILVKVVARATLEIYSHDVNGPLYAYHDKLKLLLLMCLENLDFEN